MAVKQTTQKKPAKGNKKPNSPNKIEQKTKATPMTFHDNVKKNIAWYAAAVVLVTVVVLANIIPSDRLIPYIEEYQNMEMETDIPTKVKIDNLEMSSQIGSIDELEILLQKNVQAVESALIAINKKEKRTVEQLDNIAQTALNLDVRLSQLQAEIDNIQQKKQETKRIQDPSYIFLGQKMVFLTDSYHKGNVTHKQLQELRVFNEKMLKNEEFETALLTLIDQTPDEGPVTLSELSWQVFSLLEEGSPEVEDLLQTNENEQDYIAKAKRYLSDWVQVKKLDIQTKDHPWVLAMNKIQKALAKGNVEKAELLLKSTPVFERDTRLDMLKSDMAFYINQQKALKNVVDVYNKMYIMSVE